MRSGVRERLGERRHDAASQIKEQIASASQHVLDVISENPQIKHVAEKMEPAAVQKHAGQHGRPGRQDLVIPRRMPEPEQLGRDHAVGVKDESLVVTELP